MAGLYVTSANRSRPDNVFVLLPELLIRLALLPIFKDASRETPTTKNMSDHRARSLYE